MRLKADDRGVIVSWLAKLVIGMAVAGILLFDAGAVVVNFFTLDSTADDIVNALSVDVTRETASNPVLLEEHAKSVLAQEAPNVRLVRAELDGEGVLHLRLRRRADTLIFGRLPWTRSWTKATAESSSTLAN